MKSKKLTLFVPENVVCLAKKYAKQHGTSISTLVTRLFESIKSDKREKHSSNKASAVITSSSIGLVKLSGRNKGDLISDALGLKLK